MQAIEMDIWERTAEDPKMLKYVGQRTAQEVFVELKHRLENMGFLPDEYFSLNNYWENGAEIPKDAGMFSTTDYGSSEGIYTDVYFKWYDERQKKSITQKFITAKTLGETEVDLDRMNLIASAITKCFHTEGVHARYIVLGESKSPEGCVLHLNGDEQRILIDSLVSKHNQLTNETLAVERLLRRVSGSITGYINEIGKRPMDMDDFDIAVLAVNDGCLSVFEKTYLTIPDRLGELLVCAAARPGNVGRQMVTLILGAAKDIPNEVYLAACKQSIETGDIEKILLLVKKAGESRADNELTIYGELIGHAIYKNMNKAANEILGVCTAEMIAAADPRVLPQAIMYRNYHMAETLIKNGIDTNRVASDIIHALISRNNDRYYFKIFLDRGMVIDNGNYSAMHACIRTESPEEGKMLIDRGMDFDLYLKWSEESRPAGNSVDTFNQIYAYWESKNLNGEGKNELE
jgi:hypothetical protein